jgi:hypothetical protein
MSRLSCWQYGDTIKTNETPRNFKWEILEHPPYSPGFHLVSPLKHHLLAEHFPNDEAVERELTALFRQQPKEFYGAGFPGHVKRWDKCLNVQKNYVEK